MGAAPNLETGFPKAPDCLWALKMGCFQVPLEGPGCSSEGPGACIVGSLRLEEFLLAIGWAKLSQERQTKALEEAEASRKIFRRIPVDSDQAEENSSLGFNPNLDDDNP